MLKKLLHIWKYSDSQPTEITLGICNFILAPLCLIFEIGFMPFFIPLVVAGGAYQLWAVSTEKVCKRVNAAFVSLCLFIITAALFLLSPHGLKDATHYGWLVLALSAAGSLIKKRTIT